MCLGHRHRPALRAARFGARFGARIRTTRFARFLRARAGLRSELSTGRSFAFTPATLEPLTRILGTRTFFASALGLFAVLGGSLETRTRCRGAIKRRPIRGRAVDLRAIELRTVMARTFGAHGFRALDLARTFGRARRRGAIEFPRSGVALAVALEAPAVCIPLTVSFTTSTTGTRLTIVATVALARFVAVVALFEHLEVMSGDLFREIKRLAVVEVDPVFPSVEGEDAQDRVLARGAAAGFAGVVGTQGEMQETPSPTAQTKLLRALQISTVDADVQKLGRLARVAGLDGNRVSVERANLRTADLVARAIAGRDRFFEVFELEGFAQSIAQRAHDVIDLAESVGVELEVELLRFVTEHVGQRAGNAFDQGGMRHAQ